MSFLPPLIPGGDFVCFKDPGINWAQGEGLVERLSPANHTMEPRFYSNYPPGHAMLYGIYVKLFGIGPKVDQFFDFLWIAAASAVFWFYITPRWGTPAQQRPAMATLFFLLFLLPIGVFWSQRERPDALGVLLLLCGLALLRRKLTTSNLMLAAFVGGLTSLISPFVFVVTGLLFSAHLLLRDEDSLLAQQLSVGQRLRLLSFGIAAGILPLLAAFFIQWLNDPESLSRFASNASGKSTGGRAGIGYLKSLLAGDYPGFFSAFSRYDSFRYKWMLLHLLSVMIVVPGFLCFSTSSVPRSRRYWQALALLGLAVFPLLVFPYQPCYTSLTAVLVMAGAVGLKATKTVNLLWVGAGSAAFVAMAAFPFLLRELAITAHAAPSEKIMEDVAATLRPPIGSKPLVVALGASTYFAFKQDGFVVHEISAVNEPKTAAAFDLFALSANGFQATAPLRYPHWWDAKTVEQAHSPAPATDIEVLGWRVPTARFDWDAAIYRRAKLDPTKEP